MEDEDEENKLFAVCGIRFNVDCKANASLQQHTSDENFRCLVDNDFLQV